MTSHPNTPLPSHFRNDSEPNEPPRGSRETRRPRLPRQQRGLTIVETMVAAAILAIGISSLASVAGTSARLHQAGVQKAAALRGLDTEIATIQGASFATISTYNGATFDIRVDGNTHNALAALASDADHHVGGVSVTAPTGNAAELVEVAVSVNWVGTNGNCSLVRRFRRSRLGG